MQKLARRLVALSLTGSATGIHEASVVSDRLRTSLVRFAGVDGFASLLRRALVLASAEMLPLRNVKVGTDGRLEGLDQRSADAGEVAVVITTHLLELLVVFIGESMTLRLVREAWPETSLDELFPRSEGDS